MRFVTFALDWVLLMYLATCEWVQHVVLNFIGTCFLLLLPPRGGDLPRKRGWNAGQPVPYCEISSGTAQI